MISLLDFLPSDQNRHRVAFVEPSLYRSRKFTYAEILEGSRRIETALSKKSIEAGDRIIIWGENSARWAMTFYACLRRKIVVVPVDSSFSESYVEKIQRATQARLICSDRQSAAWDALFQEAPFEAAPAIASNEDLLEIIYTSGTTAAPKGVMITHGNILANLIPIRTEYQKYERYAALIWQIGFVHLIPLSHLFGQIMGLFLPQMLGGKVIFVDAAPGNVIPAIRRNRASVLICVPKQISVLRKYVEAHHQIVVPKKKFKNGFARTIQKWWHGRKVHRAFGWKFFALISGGAALPVSEEDFWNTLGFAVIQGYGLTETAPSVTIPHPFKGIKRGHVGKALPGLEVRIADDGEILVRGPNVSPGYYNNQAADLEVFRDGWLHTGDIGVLDDQRNLRILGRKKDVIVTSEGLNVYPQDVEEILNADPRVSDAAVISMESSGGSQVHAVLILNEHADGNAILGKANEKLEGFQRVRSFSIWPDAALPRTATGKLKRSEIAARLSGHAASTETRSSDSLAELLLHEGVSSEKRLDEDLGLTSLDRLELLVELEKRTGLEIDDASFAQAKTISEVQSLLKQSPQENVRRSRGTGIWKWNWPISLPVRWFRTLMWYLLIFPLMPLRIVLKASGRENLEGLRGPILFVCNHQSVIDVPIILRALPLRFRHSLATAMGAGRQKIDLIAASLFFNTYPLPVNSVGLKDALEHTGDLVDRGYSILIFPEGLRTEDGNLMPFRNGAGVMATELKIPVLPILIKGVFEIWPVFARGPRMKGIVQLRFGKPFEFSGKSAVEITRVMERWFQENYKGIP